MSQPTPQSSVLNQNAEHKITIGLKETKIMLVLLPATVAPECKPTAMILTQIWNSFLRCKCIGEFQYYVIDVGREKSHL